MAITRSETERRGCLVGGWLGARIGLNLSMHITMELQVAALAMLNVPDAWLSGSVYQTHGLEGWLWWSATFVLAAAMLSSKLPELSFEKRVESTVV